jgi:hypothetical protein
MMWISWYGGRWRYFEQHHPDTAALLLKHADELEDDIVRSSGNDVDVQRAARAAATRHDELATGHIMLLLGLTMQSQLLHFSGEREVWDELEEQYGLWEDCQAPLWQRECRQIGPLPLEGVIARSAYPLAKGSAYRRSAYRHLT